MKTLESNIIRLQNPNGLQSFTVKGTLGEHIVSLLQGVDWACTCRQHDDIKLRKGILAIEQDEQCTHVYLIQAMLRRRARRRNAIQIKCP